MKLEFDLKSMVIALLCISILMIATYHYRDENAAKMQAQIDATQDILNQLQLNQPIGDAFRGAGYAISPPPLPPAGPPIPDEGGGQ